MMRLEVEIYKQGFRDHRWRGFLDTGINTIETKSDSRFYWASKKHVKEYLEYMCKTLDWQLEFLI
jgi:hypothetical protein